MKFCGNCGKEISEGTVFCSGCGAKVSGENPVNESNASNINESNTSNINESNIAKKESSVDFAEIGDKAKDIANTAIDKVKGFDYKGTADKVKGFDYKGVVNKVKNLGSNLKDNSGFDPKKLIAIGVALIVVIGLAYNFTIGKTENKILLGLKNIMEDEKAKFTYTFKVDGKTGIDEIDDLLKVASLEMKTYTDRKKFESNFEMALIVDKDKVVEANVGMEDEKIFIEFPEVYDECFYQKIDSDQMELMRDYEKMYECFEGEIFDILSKGDYKDAVVEMLDKNLDKNVLTLKVKDIIDLAEELLEIAEDDKKIAKRIYDSMEKIAKNLDKCKFESDEMEDFADMFIDFVEDTDKDDFVDDFEDAVKMISSGFKYMTDLGELEDYEIEIDFNFGMFNTIDKMDITLEIEGMDVIIEVDCGKGASKPKYKGDLKLEKSDDELEEVGEKILKDINNNKKIKKILGDTDLEEMMDLVDELYYYYY